jgi:HlyD family secretion protein
VAEGREVDVVAVARGPLAQSVVATGRIATPARIAIGSPLAATVLEVTVREGDVVKPGQVLARLRADDAAALVPGRRRAGRGRGAPRPDRKGRPAGGRPAARPGRSQPQGGRRRGRAARQLVAQGFYAQSKADDAACNQANAVAAASAARAQLAAQQPGGTEREAARARLEQARAQLANARARAALLTLTAPSAGTVLTRKAEPGDVASAGKVLLELADAGETRIHATVDEKNLRLLKPGQLARAVADAWPGQPFDAELYYLAPAVDRCAAPSRSASGCPGRRPSCAPT